MQLWHRSIQGPRRSRAFTRMPNDIADNEAALGLSVGSITTGGSSYYPWPNQWQYYPQNIIYSSSEEYANEVEVSRGEHDAVLRFYRKRNNSRSLVKEITVPLGVLDWLSDGSSK